MTSARVNLQLSPLPVSFARAASSIPSELSTISTVDSGSTVDSRPVQIKPQWNMDVAVDLQGKNWKSQATDWTFKTDIKGLDAVRQIIFLVYTEKKKATLYFDYIRAE